MKESTMKSTFLVLLFSLWLLSATTSLATRPDPMYTLQGMENKQGGGGGGGFGPGSGFNIPGAGPGFNIPGMNGGYGGGYGGPNGGHSSNGIISNTMTCTEKGPCHNKKLTCPAKCFKSYSGAGKGYGYGGGGGGCTMDCKTKCIAYC